MTNGSSVSVATIAFGSTWRTMIVAFDSPNARAARTYSKLRARRNSARTTETRLTQENSDRIASSDRMLGEMNEEMMMRM